MSGFGTFSWLQFSDLHQGQSESQWLWPNIEDVLFSDLEKLRSEMGPWDAVFFTGDLTQSGTEEQFAQFDAFMAKLTDKFKSLGCTPCILAVPGNHDLQRPRDSQKLLQELESFSEDRKLRQSFWEALESPHKKLVSDAFEEFDIWSKRSNFVGATHLTQGILPGDFSATVNTNDLRVGVVGLNTAFLQLSGNVGQGEVGLSEAQLQVACCGNAPSWARQHDVCFLITHHPPEWLDNDSQLRLEHEISPPGRFLSHLFGHLHEHRARPNANIINPHVLIQGSSLFGQEWWGNKCQRQHGYMAGRTEIFRGKVLNFQLWPRRAERSQAGGWKITPDTRFDVDNNGCTFVLGLPSKGKTTAVQFIESLIEEQNLHPKVARVLRASLSLAESMGILTAEHIILVLLNDSNSELSHTIINTSVDPKEVAALIEMKLRPFHDSDGDIPVTDTIRNAIDIASRTAKHDKSLVTERLLAHCLFKCALRLSKYLENEHQFPVARWMADLSLPTAPFLTP